MCSAPSSDDKEGLNGPQGPGKIPFGTGLILVPASEHIEMLASIDMQHAERVAPDTTAVCIRPNDRGLGNVKPFLVPNVRMLRSAGPNPLTSRAYGNGPQRGQDDRRAAQHDAHP